MVDALQAGAHEIDRRQSAAANRLGSGVNGWKHVIFPMHQ
jgi:hypothetical protein